MTASPIRANETFALEVNNSHSANGKADHATRTGSSNSSAPRALAHGNSDGHVFSAMAEYERALALLESHGIDCSIS